MADRVKPSERIKQLTRELLAERLGDDARDIYEGSPTWDWAERTAMLRFIDEVLGPLWAERGKESP